jgi:hypothetical protein
MDQCLLLDKRYFPIGSFTVIKECASRKYLEREVFSVLSTQKRHSSAPKQALFGGAHSNGAEV